MFLLKCVIWLGILSTVGVKVFGECFCGIFSGGTAAYFLNPQFGSIRDCCYIQMLVSAHDDVVLGAGERHFH